jgi:hypothetical protein
VVVYQPVPGATTLAAIVQAFQSRGYMAGMAIAHAAGLAWESAAQTYVDARTWSEQDLARKVAELRALRAKTINVAPDLRLEFLDVRLTQVRDAIAKGHTPPAAVADKPELADDGTFPRWASWTAIGIAAVSLLLSLRK